MAYVAPSTRTSAEAITPTIWNQDVVANVLALKALIDAIDNDPELAALRGVTSAANKLFYFTGSGTGTLTDLTTFARTLLDDADAAAMRTTLGLVPGTDVQAFSATLALWAAISPSAVQPYSAVLATLAGASANGQNLVTAADYAAMRTLLGLVIGTNVQAQSANLTTYAGIAPSANVQSVLGAADYAAIRTLLGLGAAATLGLGSGVGSSGGNLIAGFDFIQVEDQKSSGTNGGTATSGAWRTRDLNTEVVDTGSHAGVNSNQITLQAGTYIVLGWSPIFSESGTAMGHQVRFQNVTDGSTAALGGIDYTNAPFGSGVITRSLCIGRFTIAGAKAFELQYQTQNTKNTFGLGYAQDTAWGTAVFSQVLLLRERA